MQNSIQPPSNQSPSSSPPPAMPSRSMLMFNILYSMIPLLGFWLIEEYYGLQAGIIAAIVLGIGEVGWVYWKEHRLEPFALWSAVLVVVMGMISWVMDNSVVIRLKPAVLEGVFAGMFLVSSWLHKPLMVVLAKKQFGNLIQNPLQISYMEGLNIRLGILFLVHTIITIYAAIYLSLSAWALVKGVLFYVLFFIFFGIEFFYSRYFFRQQAQTMSDHAAFLAYQRLMVQQIRSSNKNTQPVETDKKQPTHHAN